MAAYTRGCCNPPVENVRPPFSFPKIGVLAGRKPARRQTFPSDTGRALESSCHGELSIGRRRLRIDTEAPLRVGLGGILRQRKAHEVGLRITRIQIVIVGKERVLPDRDGQPTPAAGQRMGVHKLVIQIAVNCPIVRLSDQAEPGLLRSGVGLGPELVLLDSDIK
jgi:hypothetical protein